MKDCDIRQAESAEEALTRFEDWEPDVALIDIVLPGMNGIQLLSEIKKVSADTEVLVMTSNASLERRELWGQGMGVRAGGGIVRGNTRQNI